MQKSILLLLQLACVVAAWRKLAPMPTTDSILGAVLHGDQLAVVTLKDVFVYQGSNLTNSVPLHAPTTSFSHAQICSYTVGSDVFHLSFVGSTIYHSADGVHYDAVATFGDNILRGILCSAGCDAQGTCGAHVVVGEMFVAAAKTLDATSWTSVRVADTLFGAASLSASPPSYIAVGASGQSAAAGVIYVSSSPGANWTRVMIPDCTPALTSVCATADVAVAVGQQSVVAVAKLPLGDIEYYFLNTSLPEATGTLLQAAVSGGVFYVLGAGGHIFTTSDVLTQRSWTVLAVPALRAYTPLAMSVAGGTVAVVGADGFVGKIVDSALATLSTVVTSGSFDGADTGPAAVDGGAPRLWTLATVDSASKQLLASRDAGATWRTVVVAVDVHGIYYRHGYWWASVGPRGAAGLGVSADGVEWSVVVNGQPMAEVLHDDEAGRYVCVVYATADSKLTVYWSTNTTTWTRRGVLTVTGAQQPQLQFLALGGTPRAYVGFITFFDYSMNMSRASVIASQDGVTYALVRGPFPDQAYPHSLAFEPAVKGFVMTLGSTVWTSPDGQTWQARPVRAARSMIGFGVGLGAAGTTALAVLDSGEFLTSDLQMAAWTSVWNATGLAPYMGVTVTGASAAAVLVFAGNGAIYTSD